MRSLFILADDLTGALDSAVQFAARGIPVTVLPSFSPENDYDSVSSEVLVQNLDSRHLPAQQAAELVTSAAEKALSAGFERFYKKTDSVLRGNVGSELEALVKVTGESVLDFVPAWPSMGRTTENGIQMLNGLPIHETDFRLDPFEPVLDSSVEKIIARQCSIPCTPDNSCNEMPLIRIHNCSREEELTGIAGRLLEETGLRCSAGCAGFARALADILPLQREPRFAERTTGSLLVVCGSVNPSSVSQIAYAEHKGFRRVTLDSGKADPAMPLTREETESLIALSRAGTPLILDLSGKEGQIRPDPEAALCLAGAVRQLLSAGLKATILATGGDTLSVLLKHLDTTRITIIGAVEEGIVLSECETGNGHFYMISKAGSFGRVTLLEEIHNTLQGELAI